MPQHDSDESCNYLINFRMDFTQRHPYYRAVVGVRSRQWWRNGGPTVEVEPKHQGGEKNKNRSFGVPGTAGTNFLFYGTAYCVLVLRLFYGCS